MDIKQEIEIKEEELDTIDQHSSFCQKDSQILPDNEENLALPKYIKNEEEDLTVVVKSEFRELEKESVFKEETFMSDDVKYENPIQNQLLSSGQCEKILPNNEENLALPKYIKNEEEDLTVVVKSEFRELEKESVFKEETFMSDDVKYENPIQNQLLSSGQREKSLIGDVEEEDDRLEAKSSLRNTPQTSRKDNESLETKEMEKLCCTFCDQSFKSKDELKSHLESHKKRKFRCAHCSYEGNSKKYLKSHLLRHSNTKLFKCFKCGYECNYKESLKRHLLIHAHFKLFKCSECSYECNREENLKTHALTHVKI